MTHLDTLIVGVSVIAQVPRVNINVIALKEATKRREEKKVRVRQSKYM